MTNPHREIVITRVFDVPCELVWRAWTDPEYFMRWWGPKVFTSPACKMDFRIGGTYLFCMRSPEGQDFWSTGEYREIVPLERIVFTDSFADASGNVVSPTYYGMGDDFPSELVVTVTFENLSGKTKMTMKHNRIPAGEHRENTLQGWNESFDKLAESLTYLQPQNLRTLFNGRVILPGDPEYDQARTVFVGGIDRRPATIIRVADAKDVARVVSLAREHGLELAVRSGGHSGAGHSVTEGGIVLDLCNMKALDIDPVEHTAWAEAGLTAIEYTLATAVHGLTTGFGDTGSVGIGGITLGGGVGYLVRKYGLTIDALLAAEIVTADGQLRYVDPENHPDLFWAIRGGGGNFGVVTRFKFRLYKTSTVFGGMFILPATSEVIAGFIAEAEAAPDELSVIANVMTAPPMPFLPEEVHGKPIVLAMVVYAGDTESANQVLAPIRALATPLADMLGPMPYPEIYPPDEENYHPVGAARTLFMDTIGRSEAQTILNYLNASTGYMAVAQLRVLGGAMARVPVDATAFAHRQSRIMVNIATLYQQSDEKAIHETWVEQFLAALCQKDSGVYVNFLGDEGESRIRAAYPGATWDQLVKIKTHYDPTNLFRLNQNIPPK